MNHSEMYAKGQGKHTNWLESDGARLHRMVSRQHPFESPKYLHQYATHAAWIEELRQKQQSPDLPSTSQRHVVTGV